jgi:hypothetical protein
LTPRKTNTRNLKLQSNLVWFEAYGQSILLFYLLKYATGLNFKLLYLTDLKNAQ